MKKQTVIPRKKRGPPATGQGEPVVVRMHPPQLAALDGWIAQQPPPFLTRPEAVRRLVELGMTVKSRRSLKSEDAKQRPGTKERARELAGATIDEMTDTAASSENQANRRRRLISGPEEFQKVRRDRSNRK